jgi:carbonic anhydrase
MLEKGNRRYIAGRALHPHQSRSYRVQLAKGQHPFAAVLTCADSRVPPELIFDEGLGDLFVVRVAGNIVDDAITGSLEYAAEHLHVPLIVVLGHTRCGAVEATIQGGDLHGSHIETLVKSIKPAVEQASHEAGPLSYNAMRDNVQNAVKQLRDSEPILHELEKAGKLKIVGAIYDIDTGAVSYLR